MFGHKKQSISLLLNELKKEYEVYYPIRDEDGVVSFSNIGDIVLDYSNSTLPPKEIFFQQTEILFEFEKEKTSIRLLPKGKKVKRIVFGIRPCDVHSLFLFDEWFSGAFLDPYYLHKRRDTILIAINCTEPEKNCFCPSFKTGPFLKEGADLVLTDLDENYSVEILTERGEKLVKKYSNFFEQVKIGQETIKKLEAEATKHARVIDLEGIVEGFKHSLQSPYWEKIHRKCLKCGICTYLCPTCYCFNVVDESSRFKGQRIRCWDSCMFSAFTRMAGGVNPRSAQKDRFMQRFYHKFDYFVDRYEKFLCTGCGRCITFCPVNVDLIKILSEVKRLGEI